MFAFGLAESLGMSVSSMLRSMSSHEFSYWKAYHKVKRVEMEQESQKMRQEANVKRRGK